EHQHLHVWAILENDFGDVLETDVTQRAITAYNPDFRQLTHFLIGHERVFEMSQREVAGFSHDAFIFLDQRIAQTLWNDGSASMIQNDRFAQQPANRRAVLEQ